MRSRRAVFVAVTLLAAGLVSAVPTDVPAALADSTIRPAPTRQWVTGTDVSRLGDWNLGGKPDFAVSGVNYPDDGAIDGSLGIFFGESQLLPTHPYENANVFLKGSGSNTRFGWATAGGMNENGDGVADLLSSDRSGNGIVYLLRGGQPLAGVLDVNDVYQAKLTGETNSVAGQDVALNDVSGDGRADVVITTAGSIRGAFYLVGGGLSGSIALSASTATATFQGGVQEFYAIELVDVNGDGKKDLVFGSPAYNKVMIYFGSAGFSGLKRPADADITVTGTGDFGYEIESAGDIDNDGKEEPAPVI